MPEQSTQAPRREAGFDPWLQGLGQELGQLATDASAPYSAAFAVATLGVLRKKSFVDIVRTFYEVNPDRTSPEAVRMLRTAAQARVLERGQSLEDYNKPKMWRNNYNTVLNTYPYSNRYYRDLMERDLNTPISQRYVTIQFLGRVLGHHIGDDPTKCDVGSSVNSGNKRIILAGQDPRFAFDAVDIVEGRPGKQILSPGKSVFFKEIVEQPDLTSRAIGIDKIDPTDPINAAWIRACAKPEELVSGKWATLHDALMQAEVDDKRLGFRQADILKAKDVAMVLEAEGGPFNLVTSVVSWYQGTTPQLQVKFRRITQELTKPGGMAIFVEFGRRTSGGNSAYLMPLKHWTELNVFVWKDGQLHRVMAWTDGRCQKARILPGLGLLARGGACEDQVNALLS